MFFRFLQKVLKLLIELLIIIYFLLLELAWFHGGVSFQISLFSIRAHNVQKLLTVLVVLILAWLLLTVPWRKIASQLSFGPPVLHGIFLLLALGMTLIVFFVREKTALTHGLMGSYYLNREGVGEPLFRRIDPEISFPNHALDEFSRENYSITWTGYIRIPRTAEYLFALRSDDGSTLFIDDQLILDKEKLHKDRMVSKHLKLEEGFHAIKISYFQRDKAHFLHFYWANPKPLNWMKIVPSTYLYPEKPDFQVYQKERRMEILTLFIKILWLGIFLFYTRTLYKDKAFRAAYLVPFLFIGILVLTVLVRLYLLGYPLGILDSDEAIEGLMAKHILTKGERPLLYYNLPYMGSLKAHLAALIFHFFGVSVVGLKGASALFFFFFVILMFLFTKEIVNSETALLTTLLIAISPGFLAWRSIYAGAAYMEVLAFGTALMVVLVKILYPKEFNTSSHPRQVPSLMEASRTQKSLRWYSLAGFLAGVGFWSNPLILYYLVTFIFFWFFKDKFFFFKKPFAVFVIFFILGVFPLLIWNLEHQWGTYLFLTGGEKNQWDSQLLQAPANFHNLLVQAFPILVGTRIERDNIAGDLNYIVIGVYILSFLYVLWLYDRTLSIKDGRENHSYEASPPRTAKRLEIPIVLTFVIVILFCVSKFGTLTLIPRYLLPLYSTFPIFLALFLVRIKQTSRVLFVLLLLSILGTHFLGILYIHKNSKQEQHRFQTFLNILQDRQVRYISTDYWIAYRITFASNEEVICAPNLGPMIEDKYQEYLEQVTHFKKRAYVAKIGHSKDLELEQNLSKHPRFVYQNIKYFYSLYYPVMEKVQSHEVEENLKPP